MKVKVYLGGDSYRQYKNLTPEAQDLARASKYVQLELQFGLFHCSLNKESNISNCTRLEAGCDVM